MNITKPKQSGAQDGMSDESILGRQHESRATLEGHRDARQWQLSNNVSWADGIKVTFVGSSCFLVILSMPMLFPFIESAFSIQDEHLMGEWVVGGAGLLCAAMLVHIFRSK